MLLQNPPLGVYLRGNLVSYLPYRIDPIIRRRFNLGIVEDFLVEYVMTTVIYILTAPTIFGAWGNHRLSLIRSL